MGINWPTEEEINQLIEELAFDRITYNKKGNRIAIDKYKELIKAKNPEPDNSCNCPRCLGIDDPYEEQKPGATE